MNFPSGVNRFIILFLIYLGMSGCASSRSSRGGDDLHSEFERAKKLYEGRKYAKSAQILDALVAKLSGSALADDAYLLLGKSYMGAGEYEKAVVEFRWLVTHFPQSEFVPETSFLLARCYQLASPRAELDQEYTKKALDAYSEFVQLYPSSEWADSAINGMKACREKLAQKLFLSAQLYYKMKQDSSALIYINVIKDEYSETEFYYYALWLEGIIRAKTDKEMARQIFQQALRSDNAELKKKVNKAMRKLQDE